MRENELMVGDWVYDSANECDVEVTYKDFRNDCIRILSDFEPIPLTPEILEKNFGEARNGGYFEGDEFYELFIIEVNDGTWIIKCDNVEFSSIPHQQVMVNYVHELQHALRLCGIDKEIKI